LLIATFFACPFEAANDALSGDLPRGNQV